ncbi:hypothetical protein EYZ11_012590 [Aspergillus tanneri]|uniref:Uncharacterized protein n=1 Tax=Aspergillus tanneri TaxID=1220188 RepID=A0A4S3IZV4_9EURO|nr:hypothetical protein EYZ11_012590 [Aspergillus tanneri]
MCHSAFVTYEAKQPCVLEGLLGWTYQRAGYEARAGSHL